MAKDIGALTVSNIERHLSSTLLRKDENGKLTLGQIVKNLKDSVISKFHRIQSLFDQGIWISNKSVATSLENRINDLKDELAPGVLEDKAGSVEDVIFIRKAIASGINEMEAVCEILKKSGGKTSTVEKISKDLKALRSQNELGFAAQEKSVVENKAAQLTMTTAPKRGVDSVKKGEAFKQIRAQTEIRALRESVENLPKVKEGTKVKRKEGSVEAEKKNEISRATTGVKGSKEEGAKTKVDKKLFEREKEKIRDFRKEGERLGGIDVSGIDMRSKHEALTELGQDVRSLISNAYRTKSKSGETFEHSLGRGTSRIPFVGEAKNSPQNKKLAEIKNIDFTKISLEEARKFAGEAVEIVNLGLKQIGVEPEENSGLDVAFHNVNILLKSVDAVIADSKANE